MSRVSRFVFAWKIMFYIWNLWTIDNTCVRVMLQVCPWIQTTQFLSQNLGFNIKMFWFRRNHGGRIRAAPAEELCLAEYSATLTTCCLSNQHPLSAPEKLVLYPWSVTSCVVKHSGNMADPRCAALSQWCLTDETGHGCSSRAASIRKEDPSSVISPLAENPPNSSDFCVFRRENKDRGANTADIRTAKNYLQRRSVPSNHASLLQPEINKCITFASW